VALLYSVVWLGIAADFYCYWPTEILVVMVQPEPLDVQLCRRFLSCDTPVSWPGSYISHSRLQTVRCVYKSLFPSSLAFLDITQLSKILFFLKCEPQMFSMGLRSCLSPATSFPKSYVRNWKIFCLNRFLKIRCTGSMCGVSGPAGLWDTSEQTDVLEAEVCCTWKKVANKDMISGSSGLRK
jgi:hypothetical protein